MYIYYTHRLLGSISLESPDYKSRQKGTVHGWGRGQQGGLRTLLGDRPWTEHHGAGSWSSPRNRDLCTCRQTVAIR